MSKVLKEWTTDDEMLCFQLVDLGDNDLELNLTDVGTGVEINLAVEAKMLTEVIDMLQDAKDKMVLLEMKQGEDEENEEEDEDEEGEEVLEEGEVEEDETEDK